jgi:L-ascorbate metabolism protein UlaG (beta-lactamase superfamily)
MHITHFGHACVLLELDEQKILIDPGTYASGFGELDVDAILITHRHFDHFDVEGCAALLARNPQASLWIESDAPASEAIAEDRVRRIRTGDTFSVGSVRVEAVGGSHALVHPDVPGIPNVGYFFPESGVLHPGDEFIGGLPVRVLLAPISGPWQSLGDAVDYVRSIAPQIAIPIHEAVLSHPPLYIGYLTNLTPEGTEIRPLEQGVRVSV